MLDIATKYYKDLFCFENRNGFSLRADFFSDEELVSSEDNDLLQAPFSVEEVKLAVFGSYSDGALGPDGLSFMFYQHCWEIIKHDLMAMFDDFYHEKLDIYRLNFAILTLIPKEPNASTMKKFRPISLLNCSFKIFTKVLTNRLAKIMNFLISSNQSAFIKSRYILESVVTAHEVLHSVHSSNESGLILKLDYEKAFDKVNLDFLGDLLSLRGFGPQWRSWIHQITHCGSVGVRINNVEGNFFITGKGLRQGDPLSPLLFNLVVDVLTKMLMKASHHNIVQGLCEDICPGGVISLQYADDTILFSSSNFEKASNLKWILTCFEQVSGCRFLNYSKSELIPIGLDSSETVAFLNAFGCTECAFLIKYLGIPLHYDNLRKEDIQPLVDKIIKRMAGWRDKLLSYGGKVNSY